MVLMKLIVFGHCFFPQTNLGSDCHAMFPHFENKVLGRLGYGNIPKARWNLEHIREYWAIRSNSGNNEPSSQIGCQVTHS